MARTFRNNRSWIVDAIGVLAVISLLVGLAPGASLTAIRAEGIDQDNPSGGGNGGDRDYTINVTPDGTNAVGNDHVFTVELTSDGAPEFDALVDLAWSGVGEGITAVNGADAGGVSATVCMTDALGQCTVTVSSALPGSGVLTASFETPYEQAVPAPAPTASTNGQLIDSIEDQASKTWVGFLADIAADATNLVGDEHVFTATVHETVGGGSATLAEDVEVTVDWDGPAGSTIDATTCTTGASGTCTFTVNSPSAGSGEISITSVAGLVGDDEELTVSFGAGEVSATKTWIEYRATIDGDAVNPTGEDHVFTVQVEVNDGSGWAPAGAGIAVDWASAGVGDDDLLASSCDDGTDAGGRCMIVVQSAVSGVRTVVLLAISGDLLGSGETLEIDVTDEATKTWVSYGLELTPAQALNLLNGQDDDPERYHVITAILTSDDAVNAPTGGQDVDVTLTGNTGIIAAVESGTIAGDGLSAVCTTDVDGTCDITIFSASPGVATMRGAYGVTVGESDPFEITSNDAVKAWTTYRVTVEPDAENLVGNAHEFVVTVEQSDGQGGYEPVAGAVPTIGVPRVGLTIDASDCAAGTDAAGTCSVFVTSDDVQAATLTATYAAAVGQVNASFGDAAEKTWIDYDITVTPGTDDNLVDTDHVFTVLITKTMPTAAGPETSPVVGAHPTTVLDGAGTIVADDCAENGTDSAGQCTVTISSSTTGPSTLHASYLGTAAGTAEDGDEESREYSDTAQKLWWDYQLTIDPEQAINAVGDAHTFTATLLVDTGEGFGPAAGEIVDVAVVGDAGGVVTESCSSGTDDAGQCTIVVNSETPGTTIVSVSFDAAVGATTGTFSDEGTKWWTDIQLVKVPIAGDDAEDGDLTFEFGKFLLSFSETDPGPKTAVYEYTITNTSPVTLENIALTDDRLGTILDGSEGIVLEAGETHVVRASEDFSLAELPGNAVAGEAISVTNIGTVTGHPVEDPDVTVSDDDDAVIAISGVRGTPQLDVGLTKRVVLGDEDQRSDLTLDEDRSDPSDPTKAIGAGSWNSDDLIQDTPKTMVFEFVITNTGEAPLYSPVLTDVMDLNTGLLADGSIPLQTVVVLDGTEGIVLAPGQSHTERVAVTYTPQQLFNDAELASVLASGSGGYGKDQVDVATVTTTTADGTPGPSASDDAIVGMQTVFDIGEPGLGEAGRLLPLSVLLMFLGSVVLILDRRRWSVTR